ncbi:hypothetical protein BGX33_008926 [Mortierella sp. NVP41]|nr:hypothetical protein BGX33_008926 [Mortierella sp. NVP41]
MLIPSSQEFDPGTVYHQDSNGQPTMNSHQKAAITNATRPLPHRYQYPLDLPRIHRLLRPLKAKIAAIQIAIKAAPSYGYSSNNTNINNTNTSNNNTNSTTTRRREPSQDYGLLALSQDGLQRSNTLRARTQQQYYGRPAERSAAVRNNAGGTTTAPGASAQSGRELLVGRFQNSLTDMFKELFDKYWWQPICDDYDLPPSCSLSKVMSLGINPSRYTLGMSCAFAVGRIIAGLSEEDQNLTDKYYHIMPETMRRFALLEHAVGICIALIPIKDMLKPLAEVCVRYRADAQAMRILEHLLLNQDETFQLDYRWAYIVASRAESTDSWISTWVERGPVSFFTSRLFSALVSELPQYGSTLIQASLRIHMHRTSTDLPQKTRRTRCIKFATTLIEESLKLHERLAEGHESIPQARCFSRREKCDRGIERLARSLFEEHELEAGTWEKAVALALALHSLYAAVTTSPDSTAVCGGMGSWVELLESRATVGVCASDFDVVVQAYGTLTNLHSLALMLDAVGLYSLSMMLIDRMMADFYELEATTCLQLGYPCSITIPNLELLLKEVGQRRIQHDRNDGWHYDEVLEAWVETTPKADKTSVLRLDELIETGGYSSEGDQHDLHPATPTRRHHNNSQGSISRDALSDNRERPAKKPVSRPEQHSPFVMRQPIRYSMTPVRRSSRSGRRRGRYSESLSESESELDLDESIFVAPMDLEVLARFTVEDDSEEEGGGSEDSDEQGLEPRSSSSSPESDNSYIDHATRSNRTSSASFDGEQDMEGGDALASEESDIQFEGENESEDEVFARPSRRRTETDDDTSMTSPQVIVLSDSSGQSDNEYQESDGNDSVNEDNTGGTVVSRDNDSQDSDYFGGSVGVAKAKTTSSQHRRAFVFENDDESDIEADDAREEDHDDGADEKDVVEISDEEEDVVEVSDEEEDAVEVSDEEEDVVEVSEEDFDDASDDMVNEASEESDYQPKYQKQPSQRRHALNTPESEPDADTEDDQPHPQKRSTRETQNHGKSARQGRHRASSPPPSPPKNAAGSRIKLRKKRPRSYVLPWDDNPSSDDSLVSDYQSSRCKSKARDRRSRRPSTTPSRSTTASLSARSSRVSSHSSASSDRATSHHRSRMERSGANEDSDMDEPFSRSTFNANSRPTSTYGTRSAAALNTSRSTTTGDRALNRRKRIIIGDDVSDEDDDDDQGSSGLKYNAAPTHSTSRPTRSQERRKAAPSQAATKSDSSDSLPRTRTRAIAHQSQPRKKIRIQDDSGTSDDGSNGPDHAASDRKVAKMSEGSRNTPRKAKPTTFVKQWGASASSSTYASTSTPKHRQDKATRDRDELRFWL